jgi:hypothetical protein
LSVAAAGGAGAQSAWLPAADHFVATPAFSYSTFDEFWMGSTRVDPLKANGESLDQFNMFLVMEYGILDRLAADVTIGYARVFETNTFNNDDDDGLADTQLGLRYRMFDEGEWMPVVTARFGGVIAGTYDENTPFAPGDGASALEMSLLMGKGFGYSGFGAWSELGYRARDLFDPVPNEAFASVGMYKQFLGVFANEDAFTISAGYRYVGCPDGLDIGGPGFDPSGGKRTGFPALKEVNELFEGALGYTDSGGRHYQFSAAQSVDGRNTGDKTIFGFAVSLPFSRSLFFGGE